MKHANDTGFYCYRAIESLRKHCAVLHGLSADEKNNGRRFGKRLGVRRRDPTQHQGKS
jgi:hypothetical protein